MHSDVLGFWTGIAGACACAVNCCWRAPQEILGMQSHFSPSSKSSAKSSNAAFPAGNESFGHAGSAAAATAHGRPAQSAAATGPAAVGSPAAGRAAVHGARPAAAGFLQLLLWRRYVLPVTAPAGAPGCPRGREMHTTSFSFAPSPAHQRTPWRTPHWTRLQLLAGGDISLLLLT